MNRYAWVLMIGLSCAAAPGALAGDRSTNETLVDVLTGSNPTARLDSGLGVAMGSYVDQLREPPATDTYDPSQMPSLHRSPLNFDSLSRDSRSSAEPDTPHAAWSGEGYEQQQDSNPWSAEPGSTQHDRSEPSDGNWHEDAPSEAGR